MCLGGLHYSKLSFISQSKASVPHAKIFSQERRSFYLTKGERRPRIRVQIKKTNRPIFTQPTKNEAAFSDNLINTTEVFSDFIA